MKLGPAFHCGKAHTLYLTGLYMTKQYQQQQKLCLALRDSIRFSKMQFNEDLNSLIIFISEMKAQFANFHTLIIFVTNYLNYLLLDNS